VGVAAEVAAMAFTGRLLRALGTKRLMVLALGLTVVRWGILASTAALGWLIAAQLLHAASFGLFHVSAVTHTHKLVPPALRATGQGLYSSLSFGLGLTVATYLAGALYGSVGAPALFAGSAGVAAAAAALALTLAVPRAARPEPA
jgi:MFS transporter, PPP family, 3-phenylpropionic acid transporter